MLDGLLRDPRTQLLRVEVILRSGPVVLNGFLATYLNGRVLSSTAAWLVSTVCSDSAERLAGDTEVLNYSS